MDLTELHWTERQEVNEANPLDLQKGVMNHKVKKIKEKYKLSNNDLVEIFNKGRKIMPNPKYWV